MCILFDFVQMPAKLALLIHCFFLFCFNIGPGYQLQIQIYGRIIKELCPEFPSHQRIWQALKEKAESLDIRLINSKLPAIEESHKKAHTKKDNTLYFHGSTMTCISFFVCFFLFLDSTFANPHKQ